MVTLLNFGDSPFAVLFYLVLAIAASVVVVNIFAYALSKAIDAKTRKVVSKQ